MKTTTLAQIHEAGPCVPGWRTLLRKFWSNSPDAEIPLSSIVESNGIDHALWTARTQTLDSIRELGVAYADSVSYLIDDQQVSPEVRNAAKSSRLASEEAFSMDSNEHACNRTFAAATYASLALALAGLPKTKTEIFLAWANS